MYSLPLLLLRFFLILLFALCFFILQALLLQELQCHFHQQLLVVAWHHHTPRHTYLLLPLSFNFFISLVLLLLFYGFTIVITVALRLRFGFGFFSIFYFRKFFHYIFRLPFCPSPSLTLATKCCHNRYCVCCFILFNLFGLLRVAFHNFRSSLH